MSDLVEGTYQSSAIGGKIRKGQMIFCFTALLWGEDNRVLRSYRQPALAVTFLHCLAW